MPRTLIKPKLHSNKHKPEIKQELNKTKSTLPPHLQSVKGKLLSGSGFVEYKHTYPFLYLLKELRRFSNIR